MANEMLYVDNTYKIS